MMAPKHQSTMMMIVPTMMSRSERPRICGHQFCDAKASLCAINSHPIPAVAHLELAVCLTLDDVDRYKQLVLRNIDLCTSYQVSSLARPWASSSMGMATDFKLRSGFSVLTSSDFRGTGLCLSVKMANEAQQN